MRVIAGMYRGRTLRTVPDLSVRPATDRVRQTLFDMLATRLDFEGARVLDLFAGSGSLGIESLSRGAAHAVFVEQNREAARFIEENLRTLQCADRATVVRQDALSALHRTDGPFDLVFADPPYRFDGTPALPARIFGAGMVAAGGYLLIEHTTEVEFQAGDTYRTGPVKRFGRTVVTFFMPTARQTP
jgi:16S rRNA (guanine(966)-N(2))-methyltransferase RsmD